MMMSKSRFTTLVLLEARRAIFRSVCNRAVRFAATVAQGPRNIRYQAGANPYSDRSSTGWGPFWAPTQGPNPTPIDTQTSQHGDRDHAAHAHQLHERAHLVDIRTRQTFKKARRIAIADGTDKVRFDLATGEEFPIDSLIVEPRHRSAVEPDGPRRYDKVGALQAAVAEGCCFGKTGLVDKPGSGINVRKQARQPVVEPGVVTDDRCHRRVCHLLPVPLEDEGL